MGSINSSHVHLAVVAEKTGPRELVPPILTTHHHEMLPASRLTTTL